MNSSGPLLCLLAHRCMQHYAALCSIVRISSIPNSDSQIIVQYSISTLDIATIDDRIIKHGRQQQYQQQYRDGHLRSSQSGQSGQKCCCCIIICFGFGGWRWTKRRRRWRWRQNVQQPPSPHDGDVIINLPSIEQQQYSLWK